MLATWTWSQWETSSRKQAHTLGQGCMAPQGKAGGWFTMERKKQVCLLGGAHEVLGAASTPGSQKMTSVCAECLDSSYYSTHIFNPALFLNFRPHGDLNCLLNVHLWFWPESDWTKNLGDVWAGPRVGMPWALILQPGGSYQPCCVPSLFISEQKEWPCLFRVCKDYSKLLWTHVHVCVSCIHV